MSRVLVSFEIRAGGFVEAELDLSGLTPDEMAGVIYEKVDFDTSVCHECAHRLSDPEPGAMGEFMVDGVSYTDTDAGWVRSDG